MSVSVVTTTISLGGLDMLFNSMAVQTRDVPWEIILADEWYEERKEYVADRLRGWNVKHIPIPRRHEYIDHNHGWNVGLRAAEGELLCFLNDFFWVYPDYIKDHWDVYKKISGYSMAGFCDRFPWPQMKQSEEVADIWWSAFEQEFDVETANKYFRETPPVYQERKGGYVGDPIPGTLYRRMPGTLWYASLNESIPLEIMRQLNGWDEAYDYGYGIGDVDLGVRAEIVGWRFLIKPTVNYKIGIAGMQRPVKTVKKASLRDASENYRMFLQRIDAISRWIESPRTPKGRGAYE